MANEYTIKVLTSFKKGTKDATFEFTVDTEEQANSHVKQIFDCGYRRQVNATTYDWISPAQIIGVRVIGPSISTGYSDSDVTA